MEFPLYSFSNSGLPGLMSVQDLYDWRYKEVDKKRRSIDLYKLSTESHT